MARLLSSTYYTISPHALMAGMGLHQ